MLATASFDASTAVWTERGGDWECVAVVEGHENEVKSCAWSPSGSLLATCGRDKTVWIWEVQPGFDFECVAVLHGHTQDVKQVAWHPTEDVLVSVSYDDDVRVWEEDPDGDDWSCARVLTKNEGGHGSTVWSAAFEAGAGSDRDRAARGDRRMATCSDDRRIVVWDAKGARRERMRRRRVSRFSLLFLFSSRERRHGARRAGAGQTVESGALQMRPGQHTCQRDRTVGLAAPAGKIATDASLTCGRLGSSPATARDVSREGFFSVSVGRGSARSRDADENETPAPSVSTRSLTRSPLLRDARVPRRDARKQPARPAWRSRRRRRSRAATTARRWRSPGAPRGSSRRAAATTACGATAPPAGTSGGKSAP